jgi:LytS/YehU family sensor histidine kinase
MTGAGVLGVGVWWLTGRLPWNFHAPAFYAVHAAAMIGFAVAYTSTAIWPDLARGRLEEALRMILAAPTLLWNLLMGSWLYMVVAGLSYTIRAQRRVRAQEAAMTEARLMAQHAQLAALRSQVNPHFLFNALHSVGALVSVDPGRADRAIERLGDLLRYALHASDEVPFADEWQFTLDYLAFEELRLGERLRISTHVDQDAADVSVPPLILQPLVENAVRHGIADRPEGGSLDLRAVVEGKRLIVTIVDDGPAAAGERPAGLGLATVRRRLSALYGEAAALHVRTNEPGWWVSLDIPAAALRHDRIPA